MKFDRYIGIDYSGAETATSGLSGLRVYAATSEHDPEEVPNPASREKHPRKWTRKAVAGWMIEQFENEGLFIAGIDHAFSLPDSFLQRYSLPTWDAFLAHFCEHWPTHEDHVYVDFIRDEGKAPSGSKSEFRLTERWTSSAKSVFQFDGIGSVGKSSHSGIPWLHKIRKQVRDRVHFWPFDGWATPSGKSVIAEVYPSILKRRYDKNGRTPDQHDAYCVARWLKELDKRNHLDRYLAPPLTDEEQDMAKREGWILGIA